MASSPYIKKLEELTGWLTRSPGKPTELLYATEGGGECPTYAVYFEEGKVSVIRAFLADGEVFTEHFHDEIEVLIPYTGALRAEVGGLSVRAGVGGQIYFPKGVPHRVTAVGDCWMIAVTRPPSEGYPRD